VTAHLIFYVADLQVSTDFYASVLNAEPRLQEPGMTEFTLAGGAILGLMPEAGIRELLGEGLPDPSAACGVPRAELYLRVKKPSAYLGRASKAGASELSPLQPRDWGASVGYCLDPDGHVLAFASLEPKPKRSLYQRMHNAFGPIAAGMVLDFFDLVTLGPIGLYLGPILGFALGWYLAGFYQFRLIGRWGIALLAAAYLTTPATAFIPAATLISALARFSSKPAPP
jgi:catechol 2,3-dioxygenase-like lactoylglutathione lyase family enzyme